VKIIFLNCWEGKLLEPLKQFIEIQKADTDVFCLQEAPSNVQTAFDEVLKSYSKVSAERARSGAPGKDFAPAQVTYIRAGIEVVSSSQVSDASDSGLGLYTELSVGTKPVHLLNLHGIPHPGKLDTPARIKQSQTFIDFFKNKVGTRIIGGDLNVLPETQSVQMFENSGYRDLINEYGIKTTRNRLVWERFPDNPLYYSDYIFMDRNTTVRNFTVPDMEISDHLPLILEIQL
jgi:endonuclease/exonuclease/phosphatase family metal-dependent hydrolase